VEIPKSLVSQSRVKVIYATGVKAFTRILFLTTLTELVIGGGGRFTAIGPGSLRMLLFGMCLITSVVLMFREKIFPKELTMLVALFTAILLVGLVRGVSNGASHQFWWEDIKPLSYFFILPFFFYAIHNDDKLITDSAKLFRNSAIFMAFVFMATLVLIHSGLVPFLKFYYWIIDTQELFFRGEKTFFYKGFLYLCIGLIFWIFCEKRFKIFFIVFISFAIVLSLTRGFIFALSITAIVYHLIKSQLKRVTTFAAVAFVVIFFSNTIIEKLSLVLDRIENPIVASTTESSVSTTGNTKLLGDRNFSDAGRFQQFTEVISRVTLSSLFVGHGFGIGIPARPVHMEISYLEIFHKQGLLGLIFYSYLFLLLFRKYLRSDRSTLADSFFCAGIFVFFQSLTNQFVNNPIGMSMVLLSIVVLDCMSQRKIQAE
jgi:hypothetical protein